MHYVLETEMLSLIEGSWPAGMVATETTAGAEARA